MRKLLDIRFDLGVDRKWLIPFLKSTCSTTGLNVCDLLRNAFSQHYLNKADGITGRKSLRTETSWDKFIIRIPKEYSHLSEKINELTKQKKVSPAVLFIIAFCEVYGKTNTKLAKKYYAWREIRGI